MGAYAKFTPLSIDTLFIVFAFRWVGFFVHFLSAHSVIKWTFAFSGIIKRSRRFSQTAKPILSSISSGSRGEVPGLRTHPVGMEPPGSKKKNFNNKVIFLQFFPKLTHFQYFFRLRRNIFLYCSKEAKKICKIFASGAIL